VLKDPVLATLVKSELGIRGSLGGYFSEVERGSTHAHNFHPKSFIKVRLSRRHEEMHHTAKTEIIGHLARTLELPHLTKSVSQVRAKRESSGGVFLPNLEGEILDILAPCPIISVFTVVPHFVGVPLSKQHLHAPAAQSFYYCQFGRKKPLMLSWPAEIPYHSGRNLKPTNRS